MRNVFIINPNAGKGRHVIQLAERIEDYFSAHGGEYQIIYTEAKGDGSRFAKTEAERGDRVNIFACGGDGTAFEVLNGIFGFENVNMGIIPCGTGNDFLKYFPDPDAFSNIEYQVGGTAFYCDVIKAEDLYAMCQCSAGMDAMVADNVQLFKRLPVSGSFAYKLSIVYTFFQKFGTELDVIIDGQTIGKTKRLFAVCANGPFYGGGFKCAPNAVPGDGKLDYSIIESSSRLKVVGILGKYRKGTHIGLDYCKWGTCRSMEIIANKPVAVNLDGEIVHRDRIKFDIIERGIKLIVPSVLADRLDSRLNILDAGKLHAVSAVAEVKP